MAIGIDPTVDFAFKKLFGSPDHSAITIHFLNAILGESTTITEVEILNPFLEKDFDTDKLSILDILAKDQSGRLLNIEVQTSLPAGLAERLTYYVSSLFVGQLQEGDDYPRLNPSIGICVLDGQLFPEAPELHLDFGLRDRKTGLSLTDHLQIHTLELPKYVVPSDNDLIVDPIDQWCFFLSQVSALSREEITLRLDAPLFAEATGVLEMIARSPYERNLYESRLKFQRDERARILAARSEGRAEGKAEGKAEGELIGQIRVLSNLLGLEEPADLDSRSLSELSRLASDFQRLLRERSV